MAPITKNQFGVLKEGILSLQDGVAPLSKLGVDFKITPQSIFGALPGAGMAQYGNLINQMRVNQIANLALGREPISNFDAFTSGDLSATRELTKRLKEAVGKKEDESLTRADIQNAAIRAFPELDLAPLEFTPEQVNLANRSARRDVFKAGVQPFKTGSALTQSGFRGDYDKQSQEPYFSDDPKFGGKMSFADAFRAGRFDDVLKSPSEFAEDSIKSSNIGQVDRETGDFIPSKTYDPAFSRAITLQSQAGNVEQESPQQETFICSALYRMGLLPRNIYLCDVIYGKNINFYTYKGYAVWGKWFAKQISKKQTLYKIFSPFFIRWAEQMAYEVSKGKYGKNNTFVRIIKRIGEKLNYTIGWISERRPKWNTQ